MVRLVLQQIVEPGLAAHQVVFGTELVLRGSSGGAADSAAVAQSEDAASAAVRRYEPESS